MKPVALYLLGLAVLLGPGASGAGVPWGVPEHSVLADRTPVAELLQSFASQQGLPIQLNAAAAAPISGRFDQVPARQFLDSLCASARLIWFWDGARLHVDDADKSETKVLNLTALTLGRAEQALVALGFETGPAALKQVLRGGDGIIILSGGGKFLQSAEQVLTALDAMDRTRATEAREAATREEAAARAAGAKIEVRVFRLTHASASDITVRGGSTQSTIPGVVRSLQNLLGSGTGQLSAGVESTTRRNQMTGLRGTGLAAVGREPAETSGARPAPPADEAAPEEPRALIQADPRINAVIIRDAVSRFPVYEQLIRQLDVPSEVIEISAAVVDIDTDANRNAGVEFLSFGRVGNGIVPRAGFDGDFGYSRRETGAPAPGTVTDGQALIGVAGLASSVLVPVSGFELLARVRALEDKGEAQLVTSPSVITLDNIEATLRQDDTVYVRVAGNGNGASSDLFNVRTGVQLRVTPSVVRENGEVSFRMVVEVQDGSFSDLTVDGVPATRESAISTQAMVPASKTLLIGGYFVERRSDKAHQVPGLGDIPYVGGLFRRSERTQTRAQRFFFITPRLVDVRREARAAPPSAPAAGSGKPAAASDPAKVRAQADELVDRSLGSRKPGPGNP